MGEIHLYLPFVLIKDILKVNELKIFAIILYLDTWPSVIPPLFLSHVLFIVEEAIIKWIIVFCSGVMLTGDSKPSFISVFFSLQ